MSKQLFIGLAVGALCTGLGFSLFRDGGVPIPVSDSGNLKLLAQVIPNELAADAEVGTETESEVIEVRALQPSTPKTTSRTVLSIPAEPELASEAEAETEPEPLLCLYATSDEPERDGIINEVAWMGTGDNPNAEWVEMQNRTRADLNVSGWQLVDKAQQIQAVIPEDVILPKGGFLLFERDEHHLPGATVLYKGALSNTDEGLRLFDAECNLQDEVIVKSKWPAGTNSPKYTAERAKDLSWHTFYGDDDAGVFGTPGKKNSSGPPPEPEPESELDAVAEAPQQSDDVTASSSDPEPEASTPIIVTSGQLIISEVMAGAASSAGDEFIELFNTTNAEIDLTGFSIKKKVLSSGSESSLVTTVNFEGKKVGAGQRFIIGHGAFAAQTQMTWPTSYSIAYTGNAALLYNAQGEKIDEVSWELSAGQSYACASQGSCMTQESPNPGN